MTPSQQLYAIVREISNLLRELHQEKPVRRGELCLKLQETALRGASSSRGLGYFARV
jgi:hypothetical protein